MKEINTKAFTLIEILATVTILGVLSVVAMVSVNKIIQNAKETHYTNAEDQLELAGQSYVQQHRSELPKAVGQKVKIPMEKLVNTNYIEQIKDYSDNGCDMKNSYVQVFKYSQSDYSYVAYLDCPVYKSKEHLKEAAPNIVLSIKGNTMGGGTNKDETQQLEIRINNPSDEGTLEKPAKLISYSYVIYKYDKEIKNSGSVALPNYDTRIDKTIDLTPYAPGKLKIVVTATNIYGLSTTETITTDFKDTTAPKCIIKDIDLPANPKPWQKEPVKITVGCTDENGSGCIRDEFTKTFKNSAITDFVTIEDNEGNKTNCEVSVNIDITPPDVPTVSLYKWQNNSTTPTSPAGLQSIASDKWTNLNIYTTASSQDLHVGLNHYEYTITGAEGSETNVTSQTRSIKAEGTTKIKYRACDNLGNCSAYSAEKIIKIDKTSPVCKISTSDGKLNASSSTDALSGVKSTGVGKSTSSYETNYKVNSKTTYYAYVEDKAGNKKKCEAEVIGTYSYGYDCNPHSCNCHSCNCHVWCPDGGSNPGGLGCDTYCSTCCSTCYDTCTAYACNDGYTKVSDSYCFRQK